MLAVSFWGKKDGAPVAASTPPQPTLAMTSAPATAHTPAPIDPPLTASEGTVKLTMDVTPRQAQVYLDQVLLTQPIEKLLPRDGKTHELRVEARGYLPKKTSFQAAGDTNVILSLELAPTWAPPASAVPTAAPTAAPVAPTAQPTVAPTAPAQTAAPPSSGDDIYGGH